MVNGNVVDFLEFINKLNCNMKKKHTKEEFWKTAQKENSKRIYMQITCITDLKFR